MATPWDRAAAGYLEQWVPRFVPYHLDLVREMALQPGERVLVPSAGPGVEVLAAARAVGKEGRVRATDGSPEMVRICQRETERAALPAAIECAEADAADTRGGPWEAVLCAFGLWQLSDRAGALRAWKGALAPRGRIGIITWGPRDPTEPFSVLSEILRELEPAWAMPEAHVDASRSAMARLFGQAGLSLVRHTVVHHTLTFPSAEVFVRAMREGCTWRKVWEELGDARLQRVAARFYEWCGGPDHPLSFDPPATVAIGV